MINEATRLLLAPHLENLEPIPHWSEPGAVIGYSVDEVGDDTTRIRLDILPMMFNWRLCEALLPTGMYYARSWCYQGLGVASFAHAVAATQEWVPRWSPDTEPHGWVRRAGR